MYKIYKYCLSKARLGVLQVSLCVYRIFGSFRCYLAFFKGWSGLFCLWLPRNPAFIVLFQKVSGLGSGFTFRVDV